MNYSVKLLTIAALIGVAAQHSQAQTTNLVEDLDFQLTIMTQGAPLTNGNEVVQTADVARLNTRDVVLALGAATGNNFSVRAQLLRVTPILDGTNGPTATVIKDGTKIVDVSGFFAFATQGSVLRDSTTLKGKVLDATRFSIRTLSLQDQTGFPTLSTQFAVQGFDVASLHKVTFKDGLVVRGRSATWTVNGTGTHNAKPIIVIGDITVGFVKVDTSGGI